jgi:hypothetical protein
MKETIRERENVLAAARDVIAKCQYCTAISPDPECRTPVSCIKLSGSNFPIQVNFPVCISCKEFKKLTSRP